jgi:hypothetical protein
VALDLCSNVEVDCQGEPRRYILHRVDSRTKVDKRKALIGCLLWHMMLCGDDARLERSLHCPMSVFGFKSGFRKNGKRCRMEYLEGTAVARVWFGVLVGYCRGNGDGHV